MELTGRVVVVTGGAIRVGKAITLEMARAGAHVVINYYSSAQGADETVAEAKALGVDALAVQADVADPDAVARLADEVARHFGGADCLVNSASHFGRTPFPNNDPAVFSEWRRVTSVLVDGPFLLANALVPQMRARGGGAIVNVVDLAAFAPWRNFAAHGAGKAALLAFSRQMALELAPEIRSNAVALGYILPPEGWSQEQIESAAQRTLLGRWGKPEEAAQAVRFLLEADFVTGEVLTVDGGERFWRPPARRPSH